MNELSLFAGGGGGILGGVLLGWRTVCAVELDPYARRVLLARQNDGCLPPFPVYDDVRTFDGTQWRGRVDVVSGGFPCQDISLAGRGEGITGERSGLWKEFARIIGEIRPKYAFVENSPALISRGLGTVLGDLSELGYDAQWGIVSAANVGAPHLRKRIWILAHAMCQRSQGCSTQEPKNKHTFKPLLLQHWPPGPRAQQFIPRMVDGLANRMDRLRCIGNGQVPTVAEMSFKMIQNNIQDDIQVLPPERKSTLA